MIQLAHSSYELTEFSIAGIVRSVVHRTAGRIRDLQVCIMNEEEIILRGRSESSDVKYLAKLGAQEAAPGATVHNSIAVE
jgi:hypothetical protein